jgi:sRNA-binding regulator protein Hfq
MRKTFSSLLMALVALSWSVARADTIHLKNGSVIKGKVTSFSDDQFVVMLDTGSGRSMSRAMIYMGDVARIEFDSTLGASTDAAPRDTSAREASPTVRMSEPRLSDPPARDNTARDTQARDTQARDTQQTDPPPREVQQREVQQRDNPPAEPVRDTEPAPTSTTEVADTGAARKPLGGQVRSANIEVVAKRDWTSTGLIITRGDRIRITATGSVVIDPGTGQTTGPEGTNLTDPKKLMQDQPTGALIAVIGADNDDFVFVGRSAEFTATRGGLLFLSVNEGILSDNTGSYKALVEIQSQRPAR